MEVHFTAGRMAWQEGVCQLGKGVVEFSTMDKYECTFCPGHTATCHLTKLVKDKAIEVHVCEKCIPELASENLVDVDLWEAVAKLAAKKGAADPNQSVEPAPQEISAPALLMPTGVRPGAVCPACGFTSEDVRKTGRLGCGHCYEVFSNILQEVIHDCQKGMYHTGKIPASQRSTKRARLEKQLSEAIEAERFEDAAVLRDQIAQME
jgi:protein arginine kinase activator